MTDFGLSKDGITGPGAEGGTKTFCGTPEYLAPEILDNKGHGKGVDWWSFGTLLYEMLCGLPPFYDTNVQKMYHKILCAPLRFPSYLSDEAKDILRGLLQRKVEERLGSGPGGTSEVKAADFFKSLDFDRVMAKVRFSDVNVGTSFCARFCMREGIAIFSLHSLARRRP